MEVNKSRKLSTSMMSRRKFLQRMLYKNAWEICTRQYSLKKKSTIGCIRRKLLRWYLWTAENRNRIQDSKRLSWTVREIRPRKLESQGCVNTWNHGFNFVLSRLSSVVFKFDSEILKSVFGFWAFLRIFSNYLPKACHIIGMSINMLERIVSDLAEAITGDFFRMSSDDLAKMCYVSALLNDSLVRIPMFSRSQHCWGLIAIHPRHSELRFSRWPAILYQRLWRRVIYLVNNCLLRTPKLSLDQNNLLFE